MDAITGDGGVFTTVTARNTTDNVQNYGVEVSNGDGQGWVANTYRLYWSPPKGPKPRHSPMAAPASDPCPNSRRRSASTG
ncbi:hypothetical protein [Streptomyces sp. YS415]|uniref:hypothetical protein n=1 Tax=Streptomyces sp. YS415 TaxID=2944806 RepID=UPI0020202163|nr:hypothetical protein [Streptomyces sp. YS415]MCL7427150.1 hypothetical protein [Streptomyces sp. YS415]